MTTTKQTEALRGWVNLLTPLLLWLLLWGQHALEWTVNDQYGYALFVPLLGAYLLFRRWTDHPEPSDRQRVPGFALAAILAAAIVLLYPVKIIFEANADWRMASWIQTLLTFTVTLAFLGYWGGRAWLVHFTPAVAFWLFSIPWPTTIEQPVTMSLMRQVAGWVVDSANLLGIYAERAGNVIRLSTGVVSVEEACSGVRSLQSTLMAAYFLGELLRYGWALRASLIAAGCALAVFFNYARTLALTIITARAGDESFERWHDPAGYMVFVLSLGSLLLMVAVIQKFRDEDPPAPEAGLAREPQPSPRLAPAGMLALALAAVTLSAPTVKAWYALREQKDGFARFDLNWNGAASDLQFEEIDPRIADILHYDHGDLARWRGPDDTRWSAYFLRWEGARSAQLGGIHNPEACLPAVGWKMVEKGDNFVWTSPNGLELIFNTYEFVHGETRMYVFYCQWDQTGFPYHQVVGRQVKDRLRDAWIGERKAGKIKLELFVYNARNLDQARNQLAAFLEQSVEPVKLDSA